MKKFKVLFWVFIICCGFTLCTHATTINDNADVVISLQINNPVMEVNGVPAEIDEGRGTTPVVVGGRTLVPVRAIVEAFGGSVGWEENTRSVILKMNDDEIKLIIDSNVAYLNDKEIVIDTKPSVINDRTMLPMRFIAESFNIGVAWDGDTQTVSLIRDYFTESEYNNLINLLPEYNKKAYVEINNNVPFFNDYEIINGPFEYYGELDELGRANVSVASINKSLMPTEERESISSVTPTGWVNKKYDVVDGGYLYNRCHLIGFQLTGENANEKNLITGTRFLNIDGMLPFENITTEYIKQTGNKVMYRATPVFKGNNLVADGVLLEAYSIEDNGKDISFCVYCYNVQPQIVIDYATGMSGMGEIEQEQTENSVYRTPTGKKYHFDKQCGGKNSFEITEEEAKNAGLTPCDKCTK